MARQKVIVKHLAAIQNFGSMDVLCSDKTGTLTSGEMPLEQHRRSDRRAVRPSRCCSPTLNSAFETGIRSPLDAAILGTPLAVDTDGCGEARRDPVRLRAPPALRRRRATDDERLLITKGAPESVLGGLHQRTRSAAR